MTKRGKRQLLIAVISIVVLAMMIGLVYLITEKDQANKDGEKYIFDTESSNTEESSAEEVKNDTQKNPSGKPESYAAYAEMTEQEQEKLRNDLGSKGFNNWLKEIGYDMETYNSKSEDEQQAFRDSFETPGEYVAWYWTAHDAQNAANR